MIVAGEASREAIRRAGDRILLLQPDGVRRRAGELEARVTALARALEQAGLRQRRVGLWFWNSAAAIEAHLAVEWIGATRVPVDPGAPPAEAAAVFAAAAVDGVVVDGDHLDGAPPGSLVHDEAQPLAAGGALEVVSVPPETVALLYPRMAAQGEFLAVPISYANWVACMEVNAALYRSGTYGPGFGDDECFLTAQQLMHGTGLMGTFPFLHMGLPQVVLRAFDAADVVDAVVRHRATATFFVPGMVTRLAEVVAESGRPVAPPLRRIVYGGAPIGADDLRRAVEVLGPVLVQVYGRFEGGWPLAVLGVDDHLAITGGHPSLARSCGRPIPHTELRIRPVPGQPDGHGELCVRNAMVVAEAADPDGWSALGDLAWLDDDGYLYLGGRLDGMINTGSYHVYPREVEDAVCAVPGVEAALVRGEPDPRWGQAVTAYIVPAAAAPEDLLDDVRRACDRRLARYKIPKRFHLVSRLDEVPAPAAGAASSSGFLRAPRSPSAS
jgi:acyl-CoA synthetase (AMP-forming)/AMP-acid ligase II